MTDEKQARLTGEVAKASREGRITCSAALALAGRLGVSPALVGAAANELGIKIKACQLGCF